MDNVIDLAKHLHGNLVLQEALDSCESSSVELIIDKLNGNVLDLAKNKYGSLVLRKALNYSD